MHAFLGRYVRGPLLLDSSDRLRMNEEGRFVTPLFCAKNFTCSYMNTRETSLNDGILVYQTGRRKVLTAAPHLLEYAAIDNLHISTNRS